MIRHILLYYTFLCFCQCMCGMDMRTYCHDNDHLPWTTFLDEFPYEDYLETTSLLHYATLKRDRDALNEIFRENGDAFLVRLIEEYLKQRPINIHDVTDLEYKIKLAETYQQLPDIVPDCPGVFLDISDELMSKIAKKAEAAILAEEIHKASFSAQLLKHRLASNGYLINLPVSQWEKLTFNIREGNYAYIWDRIQKRIWVEFWVAVSIFLLTIFSFAYYRYQKHSSLKGKWNKA